MKLEALHPGVSQGVLAGPDTLIRQFLKRKLPSMPSASPGTPRVRHPSAGPRQRLRKRLDRVGLADYEILEFLLGLAIRGRDVKPLARALLKAFGGSLGRLLDAPRADILAVPGAGPAVADALLAARTDALSNPRLVAEYCRARFAGEHQEVVAALLLDSRHRVVKTDPLSRGTIDCAALKERAAALMRQ